MLVLTRKARDQIQVGDNITITILRVKGKSVRVGIEAPSDVRIVRGEILLHADGDNEATESGGKRPRSMVKESSCTHSDDEKDEHRSKRLGDRGSRGLSTIGVDGTCIRPESGGRARPSTLAAIAFRRLRRRRAAMYAVR